MAIYLGNTLLTGPSGGTGDAVLADDQTFTGINTFNNASGIQAERIVGATEMRLDGNGTEFLTYDNSLGIEGLQITAPFVFLTAETAGLGFAAGTGSTVNRASMGSVDTIFNSGRSNVRFEVRKQTSGTAFSYNNTSDTLSTEAANLSGFAGSETGTWTPSFLNAGTQGTTTATYSKSGQNVIVHCEVELAASGFTTFVMTLASLPFSVTSSANNASFGTYYNSSSNTPNVSADSGVVASDGGSIYFMDNSTELPIRGTGLRGYLAFTLTYQTDD